MFNVSVTNIQVLFIVSDIVDVNKPKFEYRINKLTMTQELPRTFKIV